MPDLAVDEAQRRFARSRVARLATADEGGRPHLVPVTFALHDGVIVTAVDRKPKRTQRLKRLGNIAANPAVCLLADEYDEDWDRLWWVRMDGEARLLPPALAGEEASGAAAEYRHAIALLCEKYPQYRHRPPDGTVVLIAVRRWRGWCATLP
ncbi:TIGR03668 family PPOX class F420-dependent oxidoreductase [Streptomyces sp. KR80]|uniref:TIGR03668 family PPOX class F420-dependent oxidoreductase n=1 Tax=Streptomyces sp. KR80 TaxID=3457426 RepID=UPI003FD67B7C